MIDQRDHSYNFGNGIKLYETIVYLRKSNDAKYQ